MDTSSQQGYNDNNPVIQQNGAQTLMNTPSQQEYNSNNPVIQQNGAQTLMDTPSQQEYNGNTRPMCKRIRVTWGHAQSVKNHLASSKFSWIITGTNKNS